MGPGRFVLSWLLVSAAVVQALQTSVERRCTRRQTRALNVDGDGDDDGSSRPWSSYSIIFEDDELLVTSKSDGLLTVPGRGARKQDCLVSRLRETHGAVSNCHRLDRDTSGLLVLAKTAASHRAISMAFQDRQVVKTYVGVVLGTPEADDGFVNAPIAKFDVAPRMRIDAGGRPSQTRWTVLERRDDGTSLLKLFPITGRAHQLRLHLTHVGLPLVGDRLHGSAASVARAPRLGLHAASLEFTHPATGELVSFASPHPFHTR
ncbi:pseudouridine synthase [Pelagophyceae sp. CCMP2097]|nr:pseudouridine synthase [Pelagophyceae sp. CCMP2097]